MKTRWPMAKLQQIRNNVAPPKISLVGEQTPGYYETRHELHRYLELRLEFLALTEGKEGEGRRRGF